MSNPKFIVFDATVDGKEVKLKAMRPNPSAQREGQKVYNRAFKDAIQSGAILRAKLEDFMRSQGMWDDDKQKEMTELGDRVNKKEQVLAKGGIKLKQAKEIAIELKSLRLQIRELISERTDLDVNTAEGQADNARFNYWVSACVVYNDTGKPVFANMDDYLERQTEDFAAVAASKLANLLYGLTDDYEHNLPENQFLREFKFADEDNRLVNEDGKLVDIEGHLINEEGHLVNEEGERVDRDGNRLDDDGNYMFERQPFLDDDDNPIVQEEEAKEEEAEATEEPVAEEPEKVASTDS